MKHWKKIYDGAAGCIGIGTNTRVKHASAHEYTWKAVHPHIARVSYLHTFTDQCKYELHTTSLCRMSSLYQMPGHSALSALDSPHHASGRRVLHSPLRDISPTTPSLAPHPHCPSVAWIGDREISPQLRQRKDKHRSVSTFRSTPSQFSLALSVPKLRWHTPLVLGQLSRFSYPENDIRTGILQPQRQLKQTSIRINRFYL